VSPRIANIMAMGCATWLALFVAVAAIAREKPNGPPGASSHLVCVTAAGMLTRGDDWKECHAPRTLLHVLWAGW
jgi:hypothetical protein